ncbi:valine--tRNA ligase-like isoform X1 [Penaeus japonicus]|uniref:valine--tRNA ligase-like isoform X1 n=1 Tax=Penaeus japonicus TaxID=27405 RepID=UPI001C711592|nr:valine--tRNA ligase-like isoform X1 [Penaeus japonicus]
MLFSLRDIHRNVFRLSGVYSSKNFCSTKRYFRVNISRSSVEMKDLSQPIASGYNPHDVESNWYAWWEQQGFFRKQEGREKFVMVLPPPNVTGNLHLGHALTCAVQDAIARWHQMLGDEVVWVPGCDHAGIATQVVVERHLWASQGLTRHHLGREKFVDKVWKWKEEKGTQIYDQMKRLGVSLDWDRAVFTMDEVMSEAVAEAFIQLFDSGLIYRRNALVNWCCALQSAISDIEVDHLHLTGKTEVAVPGYEKPVTFGMMYDFAYKLMDTDEELVVCTTRPETMLGDTAVMVHPDDQRYQHLHGSRVQHPFRKESIPVIADYHVDPGFGTGVVKVTPGHDQNDYEVGKRHGLPELTVFDEQGRMTDIVPDFKNIPRFEARQRVLEALKEQQLFRGSRSHPMMVPRCSRTQDIIEPLLKPQWFIDCNDMAAQAISAVQKGDLQIHPDNHRQAWFEWLKNIKDWCVSRQLWWGHRIPVYCVRHGVDQETWVAARSREEAERKFLEKSEFSESSIIAVNQEEDVLDTWFSSGLFPFAVFGWPKETDDVKRLYPTTLLETGHDILFFWVARMVMLGVQLTGELPFKNILLHGLVCDAQGHKMSKSKGNVIDPTDVIEGISLQALNDRLHASAKGGILTAAEVSQGIKKQTVNFPEGIPECGADALRFTLCTYNTKNQLLSMDVNRVQQSKFLGNKIWQTVRFLLSAIQKTPNGTNNAFHVNIEQRNDLSVMDRWILSRLSHMVSVANKNFEAYDLHLITAGFITFWQNHLCDVYLESIKPSLKRGSEESRAAIICTLWTCVEVGLRVLSPFMPFLTEELYQRLPSTMGKKESIMQCDYPLHSEWLCWRDEELGKNVETLLTVAAAIRNLKTTYNITKNKVQGSVVSEDSDLNAWLRENLPIILTLGRIESMNIMDAPASPPATSAMSTLSDTTAVYLHLQGVIDPKKELQRLRKKFSKLQKEETKLFGIVSAPGYVEKSPLHIQEAHYKKLTSLRREMDQVQELIRRLEAM